MYIMVKIQFWYIYVTWNMIFASYPDDFRHKRKIYNFDPYNALLAIATNLPVLLMIGFVVQGHICIDRQSNIEYQNMNLF